MMTKKFIPKKPTKFIPKKPKKCESCNKTDCEFDLSEYTEASIAGECKIYYDLFLELEERSKLLQRKHADDKYEPNLMGPAIMIGSFAAELSLKLLLFIGNGQFDCIHNLEKLFYDLPDKEKNELSTRLKTEVNLDDNSLRNCIKQVANNFEYWRYFFEIFCATRHLIFLKPLLQHRFSPNLRCFGRTSGR